MAIVRTHEADLLPGGRLGAADWAEDSRRAYARLRFSDSGFTFGQLAEKGLSTGGLRAYAQLPPVATQGPKKGQTGRKSPTCVRTRALWHRRQPRPSTRPAYGPGCVPRPSPREEPQPQTVRRPQCLPARLSRSQARRTPWPPPPRALAPSSTRGQSALWQ